MVQGVLARGFVYSKKFRDCLLKETKMRKLWKPALLLGAVGVMVIGLLGSGAWFSDTATNNTATITAGTLSIDDGKVAEFSLGTITDMAPGDVTNPVAITIQNNGNLNLAWFGDLIVTGGGVLKDAIYIHSGQMEFLSPTDQPWIDDPIGPYTADNFIASGLGSGPYPDWYNTLAGMSLFGVNTLSVFDNNNGMGTGPYEFMGALKPGYSYRLTLQFGFAPTAGNTYQNLGPMNISLKVDATQIKAGALDFLQGGLAGQETWLNTQIADQTEP
jgi:hypothetical protein